MTLEANLSRETRIRRDAEGRWYDGDDPIEHPGICEAFDRWIDRAEDGRYCLKNTVNWAYVTIEGAPLFVRRIQVDHGEVRLHLSHGGDETLDLETLRQGEDGALFCTTRRGLTARFDRAAAFQLSDWVEEDDRGAYLAIGDRQVHPPVVKDPLAVPTTSRPPDE